MTLFSDEEDTLKFVAGFVAVSVKYLVHICTCKQIHKHKK